MPPRLTVVDRRGPANVGRAAIGEPPLLHRSDDGSAERKCVGLDFGVMLTGRIRKWIGTNSDERSGRYRYCRRQHDGQGENERDAKAKST